MNINYLSIFIYKLCVLGFDDNQIALYFGVDLLTIRYSQNRPQIQKAMKSGRLTADKKKLLKLYQV